VAIIRPVAKVGTPSGPSDFRPISIVSILSKAFERFFHDQMLEHVNIVNGRNLLSDYQSSFRRGHSTVTALVIVTENLRSAKAGEKVTVHVLRYISSAHGTSAIYACFHRFFGIVLWSLRLMV
jgi:hypothetical protein